MWNKKTPSQEDLLSQMYETYEQKMYAIAYGILHQAEQAEDMVQDTFLKLMKYLPEIDDVNSEKTSRLIMRILKTTTIDQYRRNHRESERFVSEETAVNDRNMKIRPMESAELRSFISELVGELPQEQLDVISLRCYYGFSNREAADILQISEGNASKRLERARERILRKMQEDDDYEKKRHGLHIRGNREAGTGRVL